MTDLPGGAQAPLPPPAPGPRRHPAAGRAAPAADDTRRCPARPDPTRPAGQASSPSEAAAGAAAARPGPPGNRPAAPRGPQRRRAVPPLRHGASPESGTALPGTRGASGVTFCPASEELGEASTPGASASRPGNSSCCPGLISPRLAPCRKTEKKPKRAFNAPSLICSVITSN